MIIGEERLFLIEEPSACQGISGFILRFIGSDHIGIKMKGDFPQLWVKKQDKIIGPDLFDDDYIYQVVDIDYHDKIIWLIKLL